MSDNGHEDINTTHFYLVFILWISFLSIHTQNTCSMCALKAVWQIKPLCVSCLFLHNLAMVFLVYKILSLVQSNVSIELNGHDFVCLFFVE